MGRKKYWYQPFRCCTSFQISNSVKQITLIICFWRHLVEIKIILLNLSLQKKSANLTDTLLSPKVISRVFILQEKQNSPWTRVVASKETSLLKCEREGDENSRHLPRRTPRGVRRRT